MLMKRLLVYLLIAGGMICSEKWTTPDLFAAEPVPNVKTEDKASVSAKAPGAENWIPADTVLLFE